MDRVLKATVEMALASYTVKPSSLELSLGTMRSNAGLWVRRLSCASTGMP
jgi:hypothetical protein